MSKEKSIKKTSKIPSDIIFSHQLMAALTSIKWSLKMLLGGDFGKISEEQKNVVGKIMEKNETLISLANRMLNNAKCADEKYCNNQSSVNIEDLIEFVINSSKEDFIKKNITIEFKKPKQKTPSITIDEEMVKLAIQNVLDNAIKYTPQKGKITITLILNKDAVEFNIQDSGMGIPEDQKDKVFNKFFRATNAVQVSPTGSGLGLFIAKSIMEAHKGKIWFKSKENEGSAFYFSLPI